MMNRRTFKKAPPKIVAPPQRLLIPREPPSRTAKIDFKMYIRGKLISDSLKNLVQEIELDDTIEGANVLTFTMFDPKLEVLTNLSFVELASCVVSFKWDYYSFTHEFRGYISNIDPKFNEDGMITCTFTCMDSSHLLARTPRKKEYKKVTRAYVIKKIAKRYGMIPVIQKKYKFRKQESLSQSGTDIEFCESLAGEESTPFYCKVRRIKVKVRGKSKYKYAIYYKKKGVLTKPSHTFYYRQGGKSDIIDFQPQLDRETIEITRNVGKPPKKVKGKKKPKQKTKTTFKVRNTLTGEVSVVPSSKALRVKIGQTIYLSGVGNRLTGSYYVTGVKLNINDSGTSVSYSLLKNNFSSSMKKPVRRSTTYRKNKKTKPITFYIGTKVKITGSKARYSVKPTGKSLPVPKSKKTKKYVISAFTLSGDKAYIKSLKRWISVKYLKKV